MKRRFFARAAPLLAGLAILFLSPGCEWDDDEFDHEPPPGQGSIIIDNFTPTDIEFYLNGRLQGKVNDDDDEAFDLRPGVYRVVLNDEDGNYNWADDVDVLGGQLTVLTVRIGSSLDDSYDVTRDIQ
jgi:hypothetical protein